MDLRRSTTRVRTTAAAMAVAVLLTLPAVAAGAEVPADATWEETFMTSSDGDRLHVDLFRPKGLAPARRPR